MALPKENERYAYADYCTWDDGNRWELIHGEAYAMSSPGRAHQTVLTSLIGQLYNLLRGKPCQAFAAPFDVRLNAEEDDDTVVQPDVLVVCDESKLDDKGCKGAPDFVAEIVSPTSARRDSLVKYNLYRNAGIKEYWIIDPERKLLQASILKDGQYILTVYGDEDAAPVSVLPGCEINLREVFG